MNECRILAPSCSLATHCSAQAPAQNTPSSYSAPPQGGRVSVPPLLAIHHPSLWKLGPEESEVRISGNRLWRTLRSLAHVTVKRDVPYSLLIPSGEEGKNPKVKILRSGNFQTLPASFLPKGKRLKSHLTEKCSPEKSLHPAGGGDWGSSLGVGGMGGAVGGHGVQGKETDFEPGTKSNIPLCDSDRSLCFSTLLCWMG